MPYNDDQSILEKLFNDTSEGKLQWEIANPIAHHYYPQVSISRAFLASLEPGPDGPQFLAVEYTAQRYHPDFDTFMSEVDFLISFINHGIVGAEIYEQNKLEKYNIRMLIELISRKVTNADGIINSYLRG